MKEDGEMGLRALLALLASAAIWALPANPPRANTPPKEDQFTVKVPMRDGVRLVTRVLKLSGSPRQPTILLRTPYQNTDEMFRAYRFYITRGYVVVLQSVRGRNGSEGTFRPMTQEINDGNDTLNWIARQNWSNGKVAMAGGSYLGIAQWRAALSANPHLKAIFPVVSGSDEYEDRFYSTGGAMKLGHRLLWMAENLRVPDVPKILFDEFTRHLPLRTSDKFTTGQKIEFWQEALNHPSYDAYWKSYSVRARADRIDVPAFIVGGWYDNYSEGDLRGFTALSEHSTLNRILIGPWPHDMSVRFPGVDFGPDSAAPIRRFQAQWFEYWLKSQQPQPEVPFAPVRIFVMGENRWRDEKEWPLARTRYTPFYFAGKGNANTANGDGALVSDPRRTDLPDSYKYDPKNPVPTLGGAICCNPKIFAWGPMDQRPAEMRRDVLIFTSEVLKRDMEVTGPVRVTLFASTTVPDTDFTAKLVDVFPDGTARLLCDGIQRLRYRTSLAKPELARPGEIYTMNIDAGVTSNVFRAGHRIRIDISSSNFPRFDRNPNTGRAIADETELRVANQTIYHGRQYPSHVLLPVIP